MSEHPQPPELTITLKQGLSIGWQGRTLELTEKWQVFYTILALHGGEDVTVADIYDHYPWARLQPGSVGRMLWRFTNQQEPKFFGRRISVSPKKQASKLFALDPSLVASVRFEPSRADVANQLQNLRTHRTSQAVALSELNLLLQGGLVRQCHDQVQVLLAQPLSQNDLAHAQALLTGCLGRMYGVSATGPQMPVLLELLAQPGLTRSNQGRLLIQLARHHTLNHEYDQAAEYFAQLNRLLSPEDGVEFSQYHINYGLYLRRKGDMAGAIQHTMIAHDTAHSVQWWYGVQATQSNLALMNMVLGSHEQDAARQLYLERAKGWALKGLHTTEITSVGADEADLPLLLGTIYRFLKQPADARHWLQKAVLLAAQIPNYQCWWSAYEEIATLERQAGNAFLSRVAKDRAQQVRIQQEAEQQRVNEG